MRKRKFRVEGEAIGPENQKILIDVIVSVYYERQAIPVALRVTEQDSKGIYSHGILKWTNVGTIFVEEISTDTEQLPLL